MLLADTFAGSFCFSLEARTRALLDEYVREKQMALLSPVRRRHEFELIMKEDDQLAALRLLDEWGALSYLHDGASLQSSHRSGLVPIKADMTPDIVFQRMAIWFSAWGRERGKILLDELQFERKVKPQILAHFTV